MLILLIVLNSEYLRIFLVGKTLQVNLSTISMQLRVWEAHHLLVNIHNMRRKLLKKKHVFSILEKHSCFYYYAIALAFGHLWVICNQYKNERIHHRSPSMATAVAIQKYIKQVTNTFDRISLSNLSRSLEISINLLSS